MMKKLLNVYLILFMAVSSFATETKPLPIRTVKIVAAKEVNKLNVFFNQFKADEVTIQLKDMDDYLLFTERVKGKIRYAKTYDLSNLPTGKYQVILMDNIKEYIQVIDIDELGIVNVDELANNIIYNPTVIVKDGKLDVNMLLGIEEDIKLNILNGEGKSVFDEVLEQTFKIERRYDLSDLEKGEYTLKIETQYKTMYKYIRL